MRRPDRVDVQEPSQPVKACLDPSSRIYVRSFLTCAFLLLAFNLPGLLLTSMRPEGFLSRMKLTFGLMAWVTMAFAVQRKQRLLASSLNYWDEAGAFFALALACSVALRIMT